MDELRKRQRRTRFLSVPTALAALFGCTSPLSWYAACGCAPVWAGLASDLKLNSTSAEAEDVTPDLVAEHTLARLRGKPVYLQTVRELGPAFDASCAEVLTEIRCTFWLWDHGDDLRGIELQFVRDVVTLIDVTGQYVYTKRGGKRD